MDNSTQNKFSITKRLLSFKYAFNGIGYMLKTQHNSWIHIIAAITVIILGLIYKVSSVEWCLLVFAIGLVFTTEMINTSIEKLADICTPDYNEKAGKVKDVAAGAVLITAIISVIIGLIIFLPKIFA